ncbi:MAG TPA: MarR family winged helix-turn-helix transcriptional regulator [Opitutaceae bacterium]
MLPLPSLTPSFGPPAIPTGGEGTMRSVIVMFAALDYLRMTLDQLYKPCGLNGHRFLTLTTLASRHPIPCLPSELASRVCVSRSSMTDIVDDLEHHGWVQRQRDPGKRRIVHIRLTPAGWAVASAVDSHFRSVCNELVRPLERRELPRFVGFCLALCEAGEALGTTFPVFQPSASYP